MALINCPECGKEVSDTVKKYYFCDITEAMDYFLTGDKGSLSRGDINRVGTTGEDLIATIELLEESIDDNTKFLKDYPDGYEDEYDLIKELYSKYQSFKTLCTGIPYNYSLIEFSNTFTEQDNALSQIYSELCAEYPELKE